MTAEILIKQLWSYPTHVRLLRGRIRGGAPGDGCAGSCSPALAGKVKKKVGLPIPRDPAIASD